MKVATDDDLRALLAVRLAIADAHARSRTNPSYLDRIVVGLLVGFAVERALCVALGRELGRSFAEDLKALEGDIGKLTFRNEASKAWRARTGVQHSGLAPSREELHEFVTGAREFTRELSQRVFDLDLEAITLADAIRSPKVRAAVSQAEAAAAAGDYPAAAQWTARAVTRVKGELDDYLRRTTEPFRWTATRGLFDGVQGAQDMIEELESAFAQLRMERVLAPDVETWHAIERVLPVALKTWGRDEEVIHQNPDYVADPDQVKWALARLVDLALAMESWPRG